MSFTPISIQGTFIDADDSPAAGQITFQLVAEMVNGDEVVPATSVGATLDSKGRIISQSASAFILLANDDTGTTPTNPTSAYYITPQINDATQSPPFYAYILHTATIIETEAVTTSGSPVVTLGSYIPASSMVGQAISGTNVPANTTVIDYDQSAGTLTMSANATGTSAPYVSLTIGGAVDLSTLATYTTPPDLHAYIDYVAGSAPGNVLEWDGTKWIAGTASSSGVASVTAADATITIGGTSTNPTVSASGAVIQSETYAAGLVTTEATARAAGDTTNANAITAETSRAETAEALLIPLSQKAAPSGVATLDSGSHIPLAQLPTGSAVSAQGDASHTITITTNAAGQVTAITVNAISVTHSAISDWASALATALTGYFNVAGTGLSSAGSTVSMPNTGTAGTYGDASHTLVVTTDAQGRVTAVTVDLISIPHTQISDWASATSGFLTSAPVSSVFGRTGTVVATSGDYSVGQVTGAAPIASPTFTGPVTLAQDPAAALQAATKQYVDAVASGLDIKPSVLACAVTNVASLSGAQTIDGVSATAGSRVLLTGQSTASQNGLWVVNAGAWTRPVDFASGSSQIGSFTFVEQGTANTGAGFTMTGAAITVDTNAQTWTQFSGAGEITAGTGLTKSGNTISITGVITAGSAGDATHTVALTYNAQGQITAATATLIQIPESQVTGLTSDLAAKAPLASPALTGTPTAPTPSALDNSTKVATTAYTDSAVSVEAALLLAKASNLSDVASARAALTNLGVPVFYAADWGVKAGHPADAANNTTYLNDLIKYVESLGGGRIVLPNGDLTNVNPTGAVVFTNAPIVFRKNIVLQGNGASTLATTIRLVAGSNCNVTQYQRYISTALAYNAGTTYNTTWSNGATSFCTYLGNYYVSLQSGNVGNTPSSSPLYWGIIGPVNQTTFANASVTINQTPQNITVTDGTQFGQFGGVMQFVVSGTTYSMLYTGVSGNVVQNCTLAFSASATIAGTETLFPIDSTCTAKMDLVLHGGWPSAMSPGRFDAVDNYSSAAGFDMNINVTVTAGTGDGWGSFGTHDFAYNGQRVHVSCSSLNNAGTGKIANTDSQAVADVSGANMLGGHLIPCGSTAVSGKSWNNGRAPLWRAQRTTSGDVHTTANSTTITSATAAFTSDDIGNFIYDDTSAAGTAGTAFSAGTFIIDVISATQATINQGAKATGTTAAAHIGGSYIWPTVTGGRITGVISPTNGYFYVQNTASVTSNTDPGGDTDSAHWNKVRLVPEWGWSVTEINGVTENNIDLDCQADKFGAYNAVNSVSSTVDLRANGWVSNPWTWNNNTGKATTLFTVPTGLSATAGINLGSSVGHNIRVAFRQSIVNNIGTALNGGTASRCIVLATTDGNYGTLSTSLPTNSSVIADGSFLTSLIAPGATLSGALAMGSHAITGITDLAMTGLTGATATSRFVGATAGGFPSSGTFSTGDIAFDLGSNELMFCTAGGSPGTWAYTNTALARTAVPSSTTALTASTEVLLGAAQMQIPTNSLAVGSIFKFTGCVTKTAAGTATWAVKIRFGTSSTATSNTLIATFTSGTNTSLADQTTFTIIVYVTAIGSGTTATITANCFSTDEATSVTGLGSLPLVASSTAGFDSTVTNPYIAATVTCGSGATMTGVGFVERIN